MNTPTPDSTSRRDVLVSALASFTTSALSFGCAQAPSGGVTYAPISPGTDWQDRLQAVLARNPNPSDSALWAELWRTVRSGYPEGLVYLNPGSHSIPSIAVTEALAKAAQKRGSNPQIFDREGEALVQEKLLPLVQRLLGLQSSEGKVFLLKNTTEGSHAVALSVLINAKGEWVRATTEHATATSVPRWLGANGAIKEHTVILPEGEEATVHEFVARYADAVGQDTLLVILPYVSYAEGHLLPIKQVVAAIKSKNPNTHVHIDGAHALGMLPLKVGELGCDSFATSGHKWAGGPEPSGVLWVSEKVLGGMGHPLIHAGNSIYNEGTGAANLVGLMGLHKALEIYELLGPERVWQRILEQRAILADELDRLTNLTLVSSGDPACQSAMIAFQLPVEAGTLASKVRGLQDSVVLKAMTDFGRPVVRIGVPISTSPDEIRLGVAALTQALRS